MYYLSIDIEPLILIKKANFQAVAYLHLEVFLQTPS
jgi:hypothetical protein